jgi:hypothetical protein
VGETAGGAAILLLIIVASELVITSVVMTLGLLFLIGSHRLRNHWAALSLGFFVGFAVSFVGGVADGTELRSSILNLIFTVPPAVMVATLWTFSRPEKDGYRTGRALFAYIGLWVFLGLNVLLVPFSLIGFQS